MSMIKIDESTLTNTASYQRFMRIWLPLIIEKVTQEWLLEFATQDVNNQ